MASGGKELKISQGAIVCLESKLKGPINIGSKTIVHPRATILAEAGPIVIGESNIFEEQCLLKNKSMSSDFPGRQLTVGSNNVFEVGSVVMAKVIGHNNVFEARCYVDSDIEVGNGCIIGAGVNLSLKEILPDNIIITGSQHNRNIALDKPPPQTLQLDFLSKVLPNYHHLRKPK